MKKTLLATALIGILGATMAFAATDNAAVDARVEQMKSEFNLNAQQAQRISSILTRAAMPEAEKTAKKAARMEKRTERRLNHLKEKLGLSDEQVAQMKTAMTQQQTNRQALREQHKANIAAILTPEQATKFEAMKSERKGRGGKHGGRGMHKGGKHGGHHGKYCDKE